MILLSKNEFLERQLNLIKDILSGDATWQNLTDMRAEYYGERFHNDTTRRGGLLLREYLESGWVHKPIGHSSLQQKDTLTISGDGTQTHEGKYEIDDENKLRDPCYLLKIHKYDPNQWELVGAKHSIWDSQSKGGNIKTMYSSKITVKPRSVVSLEYVKDLLVENAKNYNYSDTCKLKIKDYGKILEVNILDLHLGKLAWRGECQENYDYRIASERFKYIIRDILTQVEHLEFEKIYFIWSNDYYHFDTIENTTTAGTRQDTDLRWQKLFRIGVELLVWGIDTLSRKAPVETFYVASNHDKMTSYYATNYLYAWYKDNPNVTVSYDCIARKFVEFGNVMIGYCHGSEEGKNINNIMSKEKPEMFGRTKFRYMHCGHYHSSQGKDLIEDNGCIVRYLGSPTGTDSWHYNKGYIGAIKCGYGFVYDKVLGQRLEIHSNIIN